MFRSVSAVLGTCLIVTSIGAGAQDASRSFNPRISLILQGTYADFSSTAEPKVPGVLLGPETEFRPEGFSLGESELVFEANVDDQYRGWATVALENEDGDTVVVVEEAFVNTLALPGGFGLKFGRFFSDIGYLNRVHGHAQEFVDMPLVYRALLANRLADDGLQARWVAPTDLFLEVGAEALRGQGFPAGGEDRGGVNTTTAFARIGGDAGAGGSWRLGVSRVAADADGRETGEEDSAKTFGFTGDSTLTMLDFVFKWAQDGDPSKRSFVFNAEYFTRDEDGTVAFDDGNPTVVSAYDGTQDGFYAQAIWQFVPRWRVGVRHDRLESDNTLGTPDTAFDTLADADAATRNSIMLDYSHSEFSRFRVQFNRDDTRPGGESDDQVFVQYIMSIGSHPAHFF